MATYKKIGLYPLAVWILMMTFGCLKVYSEVRYHSAADREKAMQLVAEASKGATYGDRIVAAAKSLQNLPYAPAADNDSIGTIVIRLDSVNQREFIYLSLAAAKTAALSSPTLHDFESNLENVSRRKGVDDGFTSQYFYAADWIEDNKYRGNLEDMTTFIGGGGDRTKTLDYVSRHPEQFPALANPEVLDKVKIMEFGFRGHKIPHLKKQSIGNKNIKELLKNGDIIILNPPETDFDIFDIGIVSFENGEPHLIHISQDSNTVTLDPYPLSRLFKILGQFFYGYRWLRPLD